MSCDSTSFGCSGGYVSRALTFVSKNSTPSEIGYPYSSGAGATGTCNATLAAAGIVKTLGYKAIPNDGNFYDNVMNALQSGPLVCQVRACNLWNFYAGGVLDDYKRACFGTTNHAVLLTGYGMNDCGIPYWIVRNSWGTGWGVNGDVYFRS